MKPLKPLPRVRRRRCLAPEVLEERLVLSSGQGSTFAIMPGSVTTPGQVSSLPFQIDPSLFTAPASGRIVLGIDIATVTPASSTSSSSNIPTTTLKPQIVSVTDASGRMIPIQHTRYNPQIARANHLGATPTTAALLTLKVPAGGQAPSSYTVQVKGLVGTTGQYLVGFYLPGDANGDGSVTKTDITTIKTLLGDNATNKNYNFDADVNRDGMINRQDLKLAQENLGAATKVSPVASVNLDPASDPSLDRTTNFSTVHFAGTTTPGAAVTFANNNNNGATTTVTSDAKGAYSVMVPLVSGSNTFKVTTLDGFKQSISGAISPVVYSPPAGSPTPTTASATGTSTGSGSTTGS
jgi:hypothetical protein